jgi:hypothetical protein
MKKLYTILTFCLIGCLSASISAAAGEPAPLRKIRAAVTSISGAMSPPWAAHESGIFKKDSSRNRMGEYW